jgi:hypothetical protein
LTRVRRFWPVLLALAGFAAGWGFKPTPPTQETARASSQEWVTDIKAQEWVSLGRTDTSVARKTRRTIKAPDGTVTTEETSTLSQSGMTWNTVGNAFQQSLSFKAAESETSKTTSPRPGLSVGASVRFARDLSRDYSVEIGARALGPIWLTLAGSYPSKMITLGGRVEW